MYKVFDSEGNYMDQFPSWLLAKGYKDIKGNSGWKIVPSTIKTRR